MSEKKYLCGKCGLEALDKAVECDTTTALNVANEATRNRFEAVNTFYNRFGLVDFHQLLKVCRERKYEKNFIVFGCKSFS
jgi:hypothetical protein